MSTYRTPEVGSDTFQFSMQRENEHGLLVHLPIWVHNGGYFVEGIPGRRYTLDVKNNRPLNRVEFVVSVDGIDIHDGEDASEKKSGLVVPALGRWSFEGYRTSMNTVATFRFCAPDGSYGALTGRPKNIGVIGVAAYHERANLVRPLTPAKKPRDPMKPWRPGLPPQYPWMENEVIYTTHVRDSGEKSIVPTASIGGGNLSASVPLKTQSIGTEYGEERQSNVTSTTFVRQTTYVNSSVIIRYETADVLEQMGIPIRTERFEAPEMGPNPFPAGSQKFVPPPGVRLGVV